MLAQHRAEMIRLAARHARSAGVNDTAIEGLSLFRTTTTEHTMPNVYQPSLCLILQGSKQVLVNRQVFEYGPAQFLLVSVDLPVIGRITRASIDAPYLVVKINIDAAMISELMLAAGMTLQATHERPGGVFIGRVGERMGESLWRLLRLLDAPEDAAVLARPAMQEVLYRVLRSEVGAAFAQIALNGSATQRIARAIERIREDYRQNLRVEDLAAIAGMSLSSFHAHFKQVTTMSPLQYQKSLRLVQARQLMVAHRLNAASTAHRVGYESASQFSREYARMFGLPPGRDMAQLKKSGVLAV